MSTTFDVWPRHGQIPTTQAVLERTVGLMRQRLVELGGTEDVTITAQLREPADDLSDAELPDRFVWGRDQYAWFAMRGLAGGIDAYIRETSPGLRESIGASDEAMRRHVAECLAGPMYWSLRRSSGQPWTVTLLHGLLAAALAEVTGGFVVSQDGAWEPGSMPATGAALAREYLRPEKATSSDLREWAERCRQGVLSEIGLLG